MSQLGCVSVGGGLVTSIDGCLGAGGQSTGEALRLGFIGCGTIAAAVVRGLSGQGHDIRVSKRSEQNSAELAEALDDVVVEKNQDVIDGSDILFLGLISDVAAMVLPGLSFRADQKVISFMAGSDLAEVAELVSPAKAEAIVLPFPGIAVGGSPLLALGNTALVSDLFEPRDKVFALADQCELNAYLAAQAVLSPVARLVSDAAAWLAETGSDLTQGEAFLRSLVVNCLANSDANALIDALNTPGGYNQRLRLHMEASGMGRNLRQGLDAFRSE